MTPLQICPRRATSLLFLFSVFALANAAGQGPESLTEAYTSGFGGAGGRGSGAGGLGGRRGLGGLGETPGVFSGVPFHFTVSLQAGYDDNVFTTGQVEQGSPFTNGSLGLSYEFGDAQTHLEARAGAGITYYWDRPQQSGPDYNAYLGLTLQHKFNPRLTLDISSYTTYQTEPDFSLDLNIHRRAGSFFFSSDRLKLSYLWTARFSTATSYAITAVRYESSNVRGFENRLENTLGNEFRYLVLPTTTAVLEYRIKPVTYLDADADSLTQSFLAGLDHTFTPQLNMNLRAGAEYRQFESSEDVNRNRDSFAPHVESIVTYEFGTRSSLSWTNRYGFQEGGGTQDRARTTYSTGLTVTYGLTPRITSELGFYYHHSSADAELQNVELDRDAFDLALSARYAMTRYLYLQLGYNHTEAFSDNAVRDYSRNRIFGGVLLAF